MMAGADRHAEAVEQQTEIVVVDIAYIERYHG